MANELRIRQLGIGGLVEDNPLTLGATTLTSAGLAAVSGGVGSTQYLPIVLDPDGVDGAPEIIYVTALTVGTGSATIVRAQEGTTARSHVASTPWVHAATPLDVPVMRVKLVDQTVTNSTTLVNDNDLTFPISANDVWVMQFHLHLSSAAAGFTPDIKFALSVPSGATGRHAIVGIDPANAVTATTGYVKNQSHGTLTSTLGAGIATSASADNYAIYTATVFNSTTAGSITLQWAQLAANATGTTLKAGSSMTAQRM